MCTRQFKKKENLFYKHVLEFSNANINGLV